MKENNSLNVKISSLDDVYKHLENNAFEYFNQLHGQNIILLYNKLLDVLKEKSAKKDIAKIRWELALWGLTFSHGEIINKKYISSHKGEEIVHPLLTDFTNEACNYFSNRLNNTTNPLLRSRYAHLLWIVTNKVDYAKICSEAYTDLYIYYLNKAVQEPNQNNEANILYYLFNALAVSLKTEKRKNRLDSLKNEFKTILFDKLHIISASPDFKFQLIEFVLKNKEILSDDEQIKIYDVCKELYTELISLHNFWKAIDLADISICLDNIFWNTKKAEIYEILMLNDEMSDTPYMAAEYCNNAIALYKEVGNQAKADELLKRKQGLDKNKVYKEIAQTQIDLYDEIEKHKKLASSLSSDKLIHYLIHSKDLLPEVATVKQTIEILKQTETQINRSYKNLLEEESKQKTITPAEEDYFYSIQAYNINLQLKMYFINTMISTSIKENNFNYKLLIEYLLNSTWLGQHILKQQEESYLLINMISNPLHEYFSQVNLWLMIADSYVPNFMLFIDSITLKLETIMREKFTLKGISTDKIVLDKAEKEIIHKVDLDDMLLHLLSNPDINDILPAQEILFLRYLFKDGMGVRDKVAHGLLKPNQYNFALANLVMVAFLRLCK